MSLNSRLETIRAPETRAWRPLLLELSRAEDRRALGELLDIGKVAWCHDTILDQLRDIIASRNPGLSLGRDDLDHRVSEHLSGRDAHEYGTWVFFPWSGRLVHILPEIEYRELRLDRNRYKITAEEQEKLRAFTIGVAGLSVGQGIAVTLALEGVGGRFKLADFDVLGLSNMNRLRAGVQDLGLSKTVLAARQIFEIDPYSEIELIAEGVTPETIDRFLTGLDLVFDECDELSVKVRLRERAKDLGIPIVMDTSDRGLIDVERFDLEPDRPLFHGVAGGINADELEGLETSEKVPFVLKILGEDKLSPRAAASLIEIKQTITTWPQLASGVTLGAGVSTDTARRILLGEFTSSGRYYVDLEEIVRDGASELLLQDQPMTAETSSEALGPVQLGPTVRAKETLGASDIRSIVEHGTLAPSGGNCQPWRFVLRDGVLLCLHDIERSRSLLDFENTASYLAFGAVVENMSLAAAALDRACDVRLFPRAGDPILVCEATFPLSSSCHDQPDLLEHVPLRVTNRKLGRRVPLREADASALRYAAERTSARMQLLTGEEELEEMGSILGAGDRVRFLSKVMHREMMAEVRWSREEVEATRDGLDVVTLELSRADLAAMRLISSWPAMKTLGRFGGGLALEKPARKSIAAASAVGLITVEGTSPESWFQGGRAMQRVWLAAASRGLTFQPMTAITYLFTRLESGGEGLAPKEISTLQSLRERYQALFRVPKGWAEPMLFRVAVAEEPSARSLRRRVDDVLVIE